jgi:asparagine synthase (glutamine-hydrolysing)
MAPTIHLDPSRWAVHGDTHARGYAHLGGRYLDARQLAELVNACADPDAWRSLVGRLNGGFALVTSRPGLVAAAVDRVRTIPVFYAVRGADSWLSDDANWLRSALGRSERNTLAEEEFVLTGYVTGRETLDRSIFQVQAGCIVDFSRSTGPHPSIVRHYRFQHAHFMQTSRERLIEDLVQVHERVFSRLLRSVGDRTIVVPMSGGYDSRLIGVSLRDLGARRVICYSYGVPGNWESRISRELAEYLGFPWRFVSYSAERWAEWSRTQEFERYLDWAGALASEPHLQDWPAVRTLKLEQRIPPDSVFVPGHSGDFLAGSHIPKWFVETKEISRERLLDTICRTHYSLWDWPSRERERLRAAFARRIEEIVGPIAASTPEEAADLYEWWDLEERQAKFICNSVRVYESFGFEWRLPLFDAELMDFWSRIPIDLRVGRALYFEFVKNRQQLPITPANQDRGPLGMSLVRGLESVGLMSLGKRLRRSVRRLAWRRQYERAHWAGFALVDPATFRRTYTGQEIFHSYVALKYRDRVVRADRASNARA